MWVFSLCIRAFAWAYTVLGRGNDVFEHNRHDDLEWREAPRSSAEWTAAVLRRRYIASADCDTHSVVAANAARHSLAVPPVSAEYGFLEEVRAVNSDNFPKL